MLYLNQNLGEPEKKELEVERSTPNSTIFVFILIGETSGKRACDDCEV